ncbi:type I 3-dehydroquinate dehydratase [Paenibacillus tengchongensis]|uniref:type I 3-dehydroquinate dehydratase n=1 Tax=Paenibacillus tengchongensis TaxID=2608684 RepID=UPI00124CEDCA|nr:type I 3-dehydroquinate dehydratase [Paenibacillus tengchongensis]
MSGIVKVKQVTLGEGMPKICVSLLGATLDELEREALELANIAPDLAEWRADFYAESGNPAAVKEALSLIRGILPDMPLIFTFRSAREGGEQPIAAEDYLALNLAVIESGLADIVDVELFNEEALVRTAVDAAHARGLLVILSNHDFAGTPAQEEIVARLRRAQELGGDLPKIAVMPKRPEDVLTLLAATNEMRERYADRPIITISMAGAGVISRLAGEIFGSAVTFGAAGRPSAPGQVAVSELRRTLELLHRSQ